MNQTRRTTGGEFITEAERVGLEGHGIRHTFVVIRRSGFSSAVSIQRLYRLTTDILVIR